MTCDVALASTRGRSLACQLRIACPAIAGLTTLICAVVLLGWTLDSAPLQSVIPGMISMKVNTAVGLVLLATALVGIDRGSRRWRLVTLACLAAVAALALATLAEYAFGIDLRIDNALFADRASPKFPGRNAPATNVAFLGIALAYAMLACGRWVTVAQAIAFLAAFMPLTALCGYVYRAPGLYQNAPYPAVALNTSIALLLSCVGGLFVRADVGVMGIVTSDTLAGSLARKLLPAAIGLPFLTGLAVLAGERAGLYSVAFGSALTVTCCAFFFAAAVCWSVALLSRAARQVTEGEEHLRIALETARLGSWQTDVATGRVEGSAQYSANFGFPQDESSTRESLMARVHPDDRDRVATAFAEAIATRADYRAEYRVVRPDGSLRWLVASGRGIYDDAGAALRMVGVTLDVTEEKLAAAERDRLLAAERHARGEAEEASRLKDEFLATISHEVRTPLSAILGWSQILRRSGAKPDVLAEGLATIERNARAQAKVVDGLLDMSSIISGKVSLDARRIDLAACVEAAIATVRPTALAKGVEIDFAHDADGNFSVVGDRNRLQQVFWNLLANAVKFTPPNGRVTVRIERRHAQWQVDVIDTGEGVSPDFLPFVFDRFRQADASTTRRHGGLGLGLAIVKQLVELHGGKARVRSDGLGTGATFTISLPIQAAYETGETSTLTGERRANDPLARAAAAEEQPAVGWDATLVEAVRGRAVLVIDDEPDARALLRQLLSECGIRVIVATTTDEAIARVERDRPDVLVSDVGMPGEDGYQFIRRVRDLGTARGGDVPAIALTAYARAEDRVKAVRAGFQTHVPKPVEATELVTMIASLLQRTSA